MVLRRTEDTMMKNDLDNCCKRITLDMTHEY